MDLGTQGDLGSLRSPEITEGCEVLGRVILQLLFKRPIGFRFRSFPPPISY